MMIRGGVFAICVLAIGAQMSAGQSPDSVRKRGPIVGVFDGRSGEPLSGVQVRDTVSGDYETTTATGTVRLDFVAFAADGHGVVELRKLGYAPQRLTIARGDTAPITQVMDRIVELPGVLVAAPYRLDKDPGKREGLVDRCVAKTVTCFGPEALEAKPGANLADFLIHANGVTIASCARAGKAQCGQIAMRPTIPGKSPYCTPTFFVDGLLWGLPTPPIDMVPGAAATAPLGPADVAAMEVYPAGMTRPLRFQGAAACGVVVIWTK